MRMMLINGNCSKYLKRFKDNEVDLVFYDPPYNVGKKYENYDDNLSHEDYINWMKEIFNESMRISGGNVVIYIAGKLLNTFLLEIMPDAKVIIVHKRAAGVTSNNFMQQYHVLLATGTPVEKCKDLWNDVRLPGEGYFFREERYPNPGMTGLELTKKVLHHFSKEGDTVLDPFMGCGTTGQACEEMNRKFIGIELSKEYVKIAEERLSKGI
jgi:DNA modification methylase